MRRVRSADVGDEGGRVMGVREAMRSEGVGNEGGRVMARK